VIFNVLNAWYFVLCVTWFASGIIFYNVIN
jgi:hypothetical protein